MQSFDGQAGIRKGPNVPMQFFSHQFFSTSPIFPLTLKCEFPQDPAAGLSLCTFPPVKVISIYHSLLQQSPLCKCLLHLLSLIQTFILNSKSAFLSYLHIPLPLDLNSTTLKCIYPWTSPFQTSQHSWCLFTQRRKKPKGKRKKDTKGQTSSRRIDFIG